MSNWTKPQARALGDFLLAHLSEAQITARQEQAQENRKHTVSPEDAVMLDSQQAQNLRERSITLAVANIKADLEL